MKCPRCGLENEEGAAQCQSCGADLREEGPSISAPHVAGATQPLQLPPPERPTQPRPPVPPFYPATLQPGPQPEETPRPPRRSLYITIATVAVLAGAVVVLVAYGLKSFEPVASKRRGDRLAAQGRFPEAAEEYEKALQAHPDDAELRQALARTLIEMGRDSEALSQLEAAVEREPSRADIWVDIGIAKYKTGDIEGSVGANRKATKLAPRNWVAHDNLAFGLYDVGEVDEAVEHWEKAVTLSRGDADCEAGLAIGYLAQDKPDDAKAHYQKAVKANPNYFDTGYMRDEALWSDKAIEAAEQLMPLVE